MATYDEWNKAIAEYFVSGLPSGATVYLSVDEAALMDIGARFEQSEIDHVNWVEDFIEAVQSKCVIGDTVYLPRGSGYQSDQIPPCVAFLAAMVLAAHYMIGEETEDEIISQINYFKRLRQVFGLSDEETGRPEGLLPAGIEEDLWLIWNRWLIGNGWLHSAEHGQSNYNKFINYPLSQALLREADQEVLERLFRQQVNSGQLSRVCDRDTVSFWVRNQQFGSKHLKDLIQESDFRRYEAVTNAVFEVYTSIDWDQEFDATSDIRRIGERRMTAELYRVEDAIMGDLKYHLYPRQPRQFSSGSLEVVHNGSVYPLREERQGWFMPLKWTVDPAGDVSYEVRGHPQIKELIFPERRFWILVRDPENETSDVFAGWESPKLGENFLLLCRKEYSEQMEKLRQEDVIHWNHDFQIDDEWIEYRECMIRSQNWEGIIPQYQDLYDALKPSISATISLKGGLRVPNQGGWLEGYVPEVTVFAFDDRVNLKLMDTSIPDESIMNRPVDTNEPISVPSLDPGVYLFEAYSLADISQNIV
ncbi:MAG: hypothetical protein OXN27_04815 [Candidatus Poribacteria bacterium]|nr:hypothetical protein [Candidatus Poribacteria bacterium]